MKNLLVLITVTFSLNIIGQVPNYIPTNGLVGWYPFSGNADDENGSGNNGSVNGAILTVDRFGSMDSAYFFNGIDDDIQLVGTGTIDFSLEATFSAWINPSTVKMASIIDKTPICDTGNEGFRINIRDNGNLWAENACYGVGGAAVGSNAYTINNWYHVIGTYSSTNGTKLYVNGLLVGTDTVPGLFNATDDIEIGQGNLLSSYEQFHGSIDDIGIWNRILSACEIQDVYNAQISSTLFTITQLEGQLIADQTGATYQWLDCDNSNNPIAGENSQSFTPVSTGNYSVEVNMNGCVDTSACEFVVVTSIIENNFGTSLTIYPNPTAGNFYINLGDYYANIDVTVRNMIGQVLFVKNYNSSKLIEIRIEGENGIYFVEIISENKKAVLRILKE